MSENPWKSKAKSDERMHGAFDTMAHELSMIEFEYSHYSTDQQQRPCPCGQVAWYKATIGMFKCPACGTLVNWHGEVL